MSTPIVTPNLLQQIRAAQAPMPNLPASPVMPSAMSLPVPAAPLVSKIPTAMDLDQQRVNDLHTQGSGVSQIQNPLLRGIARAGDIAASVFLPGIARSIPGTTLNHQVEIGRAQANLANDQATQKAADESAQQQAQTSQEQALTDYTKQRPAIESAKVNQKITAANNRNASLLAQHGFAYSVDPDTNEPTITEDANSQAYRDRQTLTAMHQATADKDQIMGEIAQNHYQPGTPEYAEAQRKLAQVDERMRVAVAGLGLRSQSLDLRRQNTNAMLHGTDANGNPLPGAAQIEDDNGNLQTVGARFAPGAIKQNAKVVTFKDLAGSISQAENSLNGIDLSDPSIVAVMQDPTSTVGKIIGGKLVQGMLSPAQANAISAVRQLHEQAGILRATTGGTAAEAQAQRILDTLPVAGDSPAMAASKIAAIKQVMGRLTPGVTRVAGGATPPPGTHTGSTIRALDPNGVLHEAPAGTPLPKGWKAQ